MQKSILPIPVNGVEVETNNTPLSQQSNLLLFSPPTFPTH